jgi:4-alpha-glucanotransferase
MRFPHYSHPVTGVALPVASLRSSENCGCGEFLDLIPFSTWCKQCEIDLIQILPVNDTGYQTSPYSAISAYALHPVYIRLQNLAQAEHFQGHIEQLREDYSHKDRVPFYDITKRKISLLHRMYEYDKERIQTDTRLLSWIEENPWIREYAAFRSLKAYNQEASWVTWEEHRDPTQKTIEALWRENKDDVLFQAWIQFHLEGQLGEAATALDQSGIALKGDLPILMQEDSADVWFYRSYFNLELRAGAPPDMFSELGQNWEFPIYNWERLREDEFSWWKRRLSQAAKFYHAYRIDHVLGFFRIWAIPKYEEAGSMGFFKPASSLSEKRLEEEGFSEERITWLGQPHIHADTITRELGDTADEVLPYLEKIDHEPLYRIPPSLRGSQDIRGLPISTPSTEALCRWHRDRTLLEVGPGKYVLTWYYLQSSSYKELSEDEKERLETLNSEVRAESEKIWEQNGRTLLSWMSDVTDMLVCAEDLGVVPQCVPRVLRELGILSLNISFWTRDYDTPGEPFIPVEEYPEASVAMLSAHDTPTMRQWWDHLSDKQTRELFIEGLSLPLTASSDYDPSTAEKLVATMLTTRARACVFQIQEFFALTTHYRLTNPEDERINVPGTVREENWTYKMPVGVEELCRETAFSRKLSHLISTYRRKT